MIYPIVFKRFLQRIPATVAHSLAATGLRALTAPRPVRAALRRRALGDRRRLTVSAFGLTFPSPLGAAAGLDKAVSWCDALGAIGFGFVEVGTVTAVRQKGNPGPTIRRLTDDRALLNRMGFPNPGARTAAQRLARRSGETIIATNIGKSRIAPIESAGEDYRATTRLVTPHSDFLVINVSSPNTPGLRGLQARALLAPLVLAVREEMRHTGTLLPLLVKISPDLSNAELDEVADLAVELRLDGIVATNTTIERTGLSPNSKAKLFEGGGISGPPLKPRALEVLKRLYARVGQRLTLISVGGIDTPEDAWERVLAGATLVQAYTGFVYGGPGWPRRMNRALAQRVSDAGASSIQELIGAGAADISRLAGVQREGEVAPGLGQ